MTRRERLQAAIARQPVDRVPYAVWRHFPAVDRSPAGLAQATLRFHDHYGSDFLKITPAAGHAVEAWGCVEGDEVQPDGHRPCVRCAVREASDWKTIGALDPETAPGYADQLETIVRMGFDRRIGDAPVVTTLFSPLSLARTLSGNRLDADLRAHPAAVLGALAAITETLIRFAERVLDEGLAGIFYAIQAASRRVHTVEEYERFGRPFDEQVLASIRGRSTLTIVHAHGEDPMLEALASLPADAWNWDARRTSPTLAAGAARVPGAVMGGLDHSHTLRRGTPEEAIAEAQAAIAETAGAGLILTPGCVLPLETPDAPLAAVIRSLGGPLKPLPGVSL